jgi:hypothetical protein
VRRGSVEERRRHVLDRRSAASPAERERHRLARDLAPDPRYAIEERAGFTTIAAGDVEAGPEVVAASRRLIAALGDTGIPDSRKAHLTTNLLSGDLDLASPFMRLALDERILSAVSAYLGVVPVLKAVDVWHSRHLPGVPHSSQLFHLDSADTTQVKLFLHCSDVDAASGPLTVLAASSSKKLARRLDYRLGHSRVTDEQVEATIGAGREAVLTGPAGTIHLVDTSRCFHFGSRLGEGAPARTVAVAQYLTPYAFVFQRSYRDEAPYRHLARGGSRLQRLALGDD